MNWIERFQGLSGLAPALRDLLTAESSIIQIPAGEQIFGPGREAENLLLLLEGTVRVQQTTEHGREIVLYRVQAGESCVMTTACLLSHESYTAEGVAETAVRAAAIPRAVFDRLLAESAEFRDFVFAAYSRRISDLFYVIEEIAFRRIDIRLAQKLLKLADGNGEIHATHHDLAAELGTAREVISRQLQEFRRRGWIEARRGEVRLLEHSELEKLANSA